MSFSVGLIDDFDLVRFGFERLVAECPQLRLAWSVPCVAHGLALVRQSPPDLVISEICSDGAGTGDGLDAVRALVLAQHPRPLLIASRHDEMIYGAQVLAAGARGYLMKESAGESAIAAALAVLAGQTWTSPRLAAWLKNRSLRRTRHHGPGAQDGDAGSLTRRELQVLGQLRTGKSTKEIARVLGLSVRTVDIHRASIKKKLGLRSGSQVIAFASLA